MLTAPTQDKLRALKLEALLHAWNEQQRTPHITQLSFEERLGLLIDAQYLAVYNKRIDRARREAKLRLSTASLAGLESPEKRNLDRAQLAQLGSGQYIRDHLAVLITGATEPATLCTS